MSHQPHNDKGWLRQYIPQPTHDQFEFFIERLGMKTEHLLEPSAKQLEAHRQAAYRDLTGAVA